MSRRTKGEGSIYFDEKKKLWQGRVTIETPNGLSKRISKYGHSPEDVREKLEAVRKSAARGIDFAAGKQTVGEFLKWYLDNIVAKTTRKNTQRNYQNVVEGHIIPHIGGVTLNRVAPLHVVELMAAMEKAGASPRLRQLAHAVFRAAMNQAVAHRLLGQTPVIKGSAPKVEDPKLDVWTAETAVAFLQATKTSRHHALYVLALTTSMREGELLGWHWADIDLKNGVAKVEWQLVEARGEPLQRGPLKTRSQRSMTLPPVALEALREQRKRLMAKGLAASPWVFPDSKGGPQWQSNLSRQIHRDMFKARVPQMKFHAFRHTAATLALLNGASLKDVQGRGGWSKPQQLMNRYAHYTPAGDVKIAGVMESIFGKDGAK